jgi:hypothetical protein
MSSQSLLDESAGGLRFQTMQKQSQEREGKGKNDADTTEMDCHHSNRCRGGSNLRRKQGGGVFTMHTDSLLRLKFVCVQFIGVQPYGRAGERPASFINRTQRRAEGKE